MKQVLRPPYLVMATGLSYQQKNALRASWARFRENAVANGAGFYLRLFQQHPETFNAFNSLFKGASVNELKGDPRMNAQSIVFCDTMSSFIDKLDDVDVLVVLIQKMAKHHYNRGLRVKDLRTAFNVLVQYMTEKSDAGREEWEQFVSFICQTMGDYMKGLA